MAKPLSQEQRQEWEKKLREQHDSGLSVVKWCRENQIPINAFYYWKNKLSPQLIDRSSFTELVETKATPLVLEYREMRIHLAQDFDKISSPGLNDKSLASAQKESSQI